VSAQAYTLSWKDAFVLIIWVVVWFLITLLFLRRGGIELVLSEKREEPPNKTSATRLL
jgi:hypothetical protein